MNLIRKILGFFSKKGTVPQPEKQDFQTTGRMKKTCKNCGKAFSVDPAWEHIPNYCRDCRQKFAREKEERQRAGKERKITRKCRNCGKYFTFPSTLPHYPNYCSNCRRQHQAAMKDKYQRTGKNHKQISKD